MRQGKKVAIPDDSIALCIQAFVIEALRPSEDQRDCTAINSPNCVALLEVMACYCRKDAGPEDVLILSQLIELDTKLL